jgi:hypothetical protein
MQRVTLDQPKHKSKWRQQEKIQGGQKQETDSEADWQRYYHQALVYHSRQPKRKQAQQKNDKAGCEHDERQPRRGSHKQVQHKGDNC